MDREKFDGIVRFICSKTGLTIGEVQDLPFWQVSRMYMRMKTIDSGIKESKETT
jgi:hypothetical protein